MILLWGLPGDRPLGMVAEELARRRCAFELLDQRKAVHAVVDLEVDGEVGGRLELGDFAVRFEDISAAYVRPYDSRRLPDVVAAGDGSELWNRAMAIEDILSSWCDITPALVVNRPWDMAANGSKPYQLEWIASLGFSVPATLVTTDPEAALAFWECHRDVVYKSVSSTRSVVARLSECEKARVETVRWCPTQFQAYVAGVDYRVHVVGDAVFATRIVSDRDDYRYASTSGGITRLEACELQTEVVDKCREVARAMNLHLAGLDLRQSIEGEWFCFEVNPSPGFSYYEEATGQRISQAVADLLLQSSRIADKGELTQCV